MSQGKNKSALMVAFMASLPSLFKRSTQAANLIKVGAPSSEKKQFAIDIFTNIVATAAPTIAINNPQWSEVMGGITDGYVAAQNVAGSMPEVSTATLGAIPAHDIGIAPETK